MLETLPKSKYSKKDAISCIRRSFEPARGAEIQVVGKRERELVANHGLISVLVDIISTGDGRNHFLLHFSHDVDLEKSLGALLVCWGWWAQNSTSSPLQLRRPLINIIVLEESDDHTLLVVKVVLVVVLLGRG